MKEEAVLSCYDVDDADACGDALCCDGINVGWCRDSILLQTSCLGENLLGSGFLKDGEMSIDS